MSRFQKTVLGFLMAVLVICVWACWEREIPMADMLPDTAWTNIRLLTGDVNSPEREQELASPPLEEILAAISETKVTRDTKKSQLDDRYFQLYLGSEEGQPTVVYVNQNGRIQIAADMDLNHYQYFKDGEELYHALEVICTGLPLRITPHSTLHTEIVYSAFGLNINSH